MFPEEETSTHVEYTQIYTIFINSIYHYKSHGILLIVIWIKLVLYQRSMYLPPKRLLAQLKSITSKTFGNLVKSHSFVRVVVIQSLSIIKIKNTSKGIPFCSECMRQMGTHRVKPFVLVNSAKPRKSSYTTKHISELKHQWEERWIYIFYLLFAYLF